MDPAKLPADPRPDLDADPGRQARPRPRASTTGPHDAEFDDFILHVDGWLCEIKDVQIRDGLHVLGQRPGRRRPGQPRAGDAAGAARSGAGRPARCPACARPRPDEDGAATRASVDERRGAGPRAGRRRWTTRGWDLGGDCRRGARSWAVPNTPVRARSWTFAATEVVPRLAAHHRRARPHVLHALDGGFVPAGPSRLAAARAGQRAADRPQLLLGRPEGGPVPAGLGDRPGAGRLAARPLPRRHRRLAALGRPVGVGHLARCAPPATTSPRCWRCSACGRSGTTPPAASPASRSIALGELGRPRIDVTVRISGFFRDAFPHVVAMLDDAVAPGRRRSTSPTSRTTSAPTRRPTSPSTATNGAPPPGSSAPSRAPTARACCR